MAFTMMGSRGDVRMRLRPRKERGPKGIVPKVKSIIPNVNRTHTVLPGAKQAKPSFISKVKSFFARGDR